MLALIQCLCVLTISGHELEFIDELNGRNEEGQSFPTASFSSCKNVSVEKQTT